MKDRNLHTDQTVHTDQAWNELYSRLEQDNLIPARGQKRLMRPVFAGMAAAIDDQGMRDVAAWYASQKLKPEAAKSEASIELGKKLWRQGDFRKGIPACAGCHGPAGAGLPAQYPRLAGQFAAYTENQLKSFRDETRGNDPEKMMRVIAAKLSDVEIKAVADYAAGLR